MPDRTMMGHFGQNLLRSGGQQRSCARVRALVEAETAQPALGFIGEPRVNALRLNLALDAAELR